MTTLQMVTTWLLLTMPTLVLLTTLMKQETRFLDLQPTVSITQLKQSQQTVRLTIKFMMLV